MNVRQNIETILKLEKDTGQISFIEGLTDDTQVENKYSFVCDLFENIDDVSKQNILDEMILCNALSPVAASCILLNGFGDNPVLKERLDHHFKGKSGYDWLFNATYYKIKYDGLNRYCAHISGKLAQMSHINEMYHKRYDKEKFDSKPFSGRCAVYTAITGGYDNPLEPEYINPNWDYFCFTDAGGKNKSTVWNIKNIYDYLDDSLGDLSSRYAKTHAHQLLPDYDYTIYVDGNMKIIGDLSKYIDKYSRECKMLAFPHPSRSTLKEKAQAIIGYKKAKPEEVYAQMEKYYGDGYQDEVPLISSGCLVRANKDKELNKIMEEWWTEIKEMGRRDQMSLGYVCWKNDYKFDLCDLHIYENPYIRILAHNR